MTRLNARNVDYTQRVCKQNAIFWVKEKFPLFFIELCSGCEACWITCPNDAIKPAEELAGESLSIM